MKHTPGPWHVSTILPDKAKGHTFEPTIAIVAHSVQFDATVRIADIPDVSFDDWTEELATAALIAEAPEMFDLMREVYENQGREGWPGIDAEQDRFKALMTRLGLVAPGDQRA